MHKLTKQDVLDIKESRAMLVDVRTADEYNSGHADCAINIPSDDIDLNRLNEKKRYFFIAEAAIDQCWLSMN